MPVIIWNWSIHCPSLSGIFNSLHSSMNQELFGKTVCNQSRHYEKCGRFPFNMQGKPSCKLALFTVSKDEWNAKELVSPCRMHWTYCSMPKGTSQAEPTWNSEIIKPVALAVSSYTGLKVSVRIPLNIFLKFYGNFFEGISSWPESLFGLFFT